MNDGDGIGTFTDERDGQTYKTVKMPDGKVWMAQNLNYKPESGNSWCYGNDESMGEKYGRLYDWDTAKIVCPKGWRLPSREDWDYLGQAVGGERTPGEYGRIHWYGAGKKLKSKSGWNRDDYKNVSGNNNGTDNYGFSALPGGTRYSSGTFYDAGLYGIWWMATEAEDNTDIAYIQGIYCNSDSVYEDFYDKSYGFSVRCVADT